MKPLPRAEGVLRKAPGSRFGHRIRLTEIHSKSSFGDHDFQDFENFRRRYQRHVNGEISQSTGKKLDKNVLFHKIFKKNRNKILEPIAPETAKSDNALESGFPEMAEQSDEDTLEPVKTEIKDKLDYQACLSFLKPHEDTAEQSVEILNDDSERSGEESTHSSDEEFVDDAIVDDKQPSALALLNQQRQDDDLDFFQR